MNKFDDSIKETFSNIHPSDECIERLLNMTNIKKRNCFKPVIIRVAPIVLVLAMTIGSVFGINTLTKNNNDFLSPAGYRIGGIMSVEAKNELKGSVNVSSGYDMGYWIYTKNITGLSDEEIEKEKLQLAKVCMCFGDKKLIEEEHFDEFTLADTLKNRVHRNNNILYATDRGNVEQSITLCGIDNPSAVKRICVSNENTSGYVIIEANDLYYTEKPDGTFFYSNKNVDTTKTSIRSHKATLSGERYQKCRAIEAPEAVAYWEQALDKNSLFYGKELATGKVFYMIYEFSEDFYDILGENPDYDFTKYSDKINISVEFNDGKTAENILEISMDKNAKVYCSQTYYALTN